MPTMLTTPLPGQNDLSLNATFRNKSHADLGMVANFTNPFTSHDTSMSAFFLAQQTAQVNLSATFRRTATLSLSANFTNPKHIYQFPMSASFYRNVGTFSQLMSARFKQTYNFTMSANMYQIVQKNFTMSAFFGHALTMPMTAHFYAVSKQDMNMSAFLGHLIAQIPLNSTFIQFGQQNLNANIVVQSYIAPKLITFDAQKDFTASLYVRGPSTADLYMGAIFGGITKNDFKATIEIVNKYHGASGVPVYANDGASQLVGVSEADGYFFIGGLVPGSYRIFPQKQGITFNPPYIDVTITDENVSLYFDANGNFESETLTPQPIAPLNACLVNVDDSQPGTFSVDGYIAPLSTALGQSIIVTAANETDAAKFRQTFRRNRSGGT